MKRKKTKQLLEKLTTLFGELNVNKTETAEFEEKTVYILNDVVELVEDSNGIYPALTSKIIERIPSVIVDMRAIPYICNGADIMAPGITELKSSFKENELVIIRDINHEKALAVGRALKSSEGIEVTKKGKVIINLHFVGDKLWEAIS
jgi:PUA domain protein